MAEKDVEAGQDTSEETAEAKEQAPVNEAEAGQEDTVEEKVEAKEQPPAKEVETGQDTVEEPAAVKEEPPVKEEAEKAKEELIEAKEEKKIPKAKKEAVSEQPAPTAKEKVKMSPAIEKMMATIKKMTVLELAELVKALEAEFEVSAAAPVVATTAAAAPTEAAAPAAEEQTEFNVILTSIGANKINVIKAVREVTTLGLKESKDLVESAPKAVREGINKEEATAIKEKLEAAGATAEIK